MPERLLHRVDKAERLVRKLYNAPTVPIYDISSLPQDAVIGQVAIGSDNSFNWYDGSWHTQAGTASIVGQVPQDSVDGQIVIGSDGSFHWCIGGTWYTDGNGVQPSTTGDLPQDLVTGQVAIGTDGSFHWYDGANWQTFL